jgi:hypothetical protein
MGMGRIKRGRRLGEGRGDGFGVGKGRSDGLRGRRSGEGRGDGFGAGKHPMFAPGSHMAVDKEILWWRRDEYSGADKVVYLSLTMLTCGKVPSRKVQ